MYLVLLINSLNNCQTHSILWITESRTTLGIVDECVWTCKKNPCYLVRYNSEEVPAGVSAGSNVSFVAEFADHILILNMKELYAKGTDTSGDDDEELTDELEFSDDEEAEYKRSLRPAKRHSERQHEPKKPSGDEKRHATKEPG
jgi:H/ACA ribonucleoprotein complex non-core subunit NAF1